ncbi:sugar transferase [Enterococcus alcedinis]|uniref:Multidrug MFS transporter n=1 Tax=Enterococcus alcedinis TaxID=1274384 RepID=A0A917N4Y8_9ENTE|nr:sugar transferase [Enterococcus alcedinis]MBP2102759.1 lipopolysaccharide/colanic/teichoic acid biosynthesis glycosyltransferase [Enterococcus alcedinis]GGI66320.1 multidrug MFS transporter [Enterococcus alcedinis]
MEQSEIQSKGTPLNFTKSKVDIKAVNKKYVFFFCKRVIDLVGSVLGLILLFPFFVVLAILMKIEDFKAPIFFSQTRIGLNGKKFKMYKIRSMVVNAEELLEELLEQNEVEGAMFKMKDDPRITKVGKFIRKTSIDELPQLWNVVKGDMSLVGPRPPLEREVEEYTKYDMQRLLIKPGCTGLWQVSGRNSLSFSEMVELDLQYISNLSISRDILIGIKTIKVIIKPNDGY